jgi:hypothetical protein
LSVENARNLVKRPTNDIPKIIERVKSGEEKVSVIFPERAAVPANRAHDNRRNAQGVTIKDMPKHDPDAQVIGLTYTIPSWVNAIDRVFMSDTLREVSAPARKKLIRELSALKSTTDSMMNRLLKPTRRKGRL